MKFSIKKYQALALAVLTGSIFCISFAQNSDGPKPPLKAGYPLMESPHSNPIAINGDYVYVTNTPSATVDVIDRHTEKVVDRIHVGIDPVAIAVRPDGKEIWVSNHVSDSVSVIDSDPKSSTFHVVIATIQEFDGNKATNFDEPVGIAFASNEKAYVALSSENQIAVINVKDRSISRRLKINAQDPRAILVKNGKLFVIPFESGNRTQLSSGNKTNKSPDGLVTFDAFEHFVKNNNVLSAGYVEDIVKHFKQPDIDLYVFSTYSDNLIETYNSLGTLLYGIDVDSNANVYIAQTDARNDVNGKAGTKKHNLSHLENRPYLNQISKLSPIPDDANNRDIHALKPRLIQLEPLPPKQPEKNAALATPYGIKVSADGQTVLATASGSNVVFAMDAATDAVLSKTTVGAGPVGLALDESADGQTYAWVYNAFDNTVSKVNFKDKTEIKTETTIALNDPTELSVKKGRQYFNSAAVSTTGTFSCASCHPNGHIDQLIWVLDAPIVDFGKQIQPRSTMPVRGLRDTEPFHWDGTQGDPYGGMNSTKLRGWVKPNCTQQDPISCIKFLIDGNISSTMKLTIADKSQPLPLSNEQVKDLAIYNLSVPYPPAPKRPYDNILNATTKKGFELFHIKGDNNPIHPLPNVCGNCHRFPFFTSTKTKDPLIGMDAPTWRGAYDRHMILPQGRLNIIDFPWIENIAKDGRDEFKIWQQSWSGNSGPRHEFDPIWNMVLEGSTGFSGAFARQFTVNQFNFDVGLTTDLLSALESAATQETVVLEAEGAFIDGVAARKFEMQFDATYKGGVYVEKAAVRKYYTRSDLTKLAGEGKFIGTFTARHGAKADLFKYPQPAIWSVGPIQEQRGKQSFPIVSSTQKSMTVSGRHFMDDAHVFVDGKRVDGMVNVKEGEKVSITLANLPPPGMHLLQVQAPEGRMSNDFIFHAK